MNYNAAAAPAAARAASLSDTDVLNRGALLAG
jgi:hypothetical protein